MAWRPHGRARVDASSPRAFAVCDRCGFLYNHCDLRWQNDWRGSQLVNIRVLVCYRCLDIPYEGRRPLALPPDPEPVLNARPENYAVDEGGSGGLPQNIYPEFWDEPGASWDDGTSTWDTP